MSYIYLCYHPDNHATMEKIRDDLRKHRLIVEAQSVHTADKADALYQAIDDSVCIIVLLSPSSQQSQLIRDAMHYASNDGIGVFPVLIAGDVDNKFLEGVKLEPLIDISADYREGINDLTVNLWDKVLEAVGIALQLPSLPQSLSEVKSFFKNWSTLLIIGTTQVGKRGYLRLASNVIISNDRKSRSLHPDLDLGNYEPRRIIIDAEKTVFKYLFGVKAVWSEPRFDNYIHNSEFSESLHYHHISAFGIVVVIHNMRSETFMATREMILRYHQKNPRAMLMVALFGFSQELEGAQPVKITKDLLGLPESTIYVENAINFANFESHNEILFQLLFDCTNPKIVPAPLTFHKPQLGGLSTKLEPPQATQTHYDFDKLIIRRANPVMDSQAMASFYNWEIKREHYSQKAIYDTFADYGYLMATVDDHIVGLMRFQMMDFICNADFVVLTLPKTQEEKNKHSKKTKREQQIMNYYTQRLVRPLFDHFHDICRTSDIEFIILLNDEPYEWHLRLTHDYYLRYKSNLFFNPWVQAFERLGIEEAMTKQLRDNLILDPDIEITKQASSERHST